MDIALISPGYGAVQSDIAISPPDLLIDHDLETAVRLSLFTNRLADASDVDAGTDRKGWWGDSYAEVNGDLIGSKLWLLQRAKQTIETETLARQYCLEALQWIIEDQVAEALTVDAKFIKLYTLQINVEIFRPRTNQNNFKFNFVWSQL